MEDVWQQLRQADLINLGSCLMIFLITCGYLKVLNSRETD